MEQTVTSQNQLEQASAGFTDDAHLADLVRQLISSMNK